MKHSISTNLFKQYIISTLFCRLCSNNGMSSRQGSIFTAVKQFQPYFASKWITDNSEYSFNYFGVKYRFYLLLQKRKENSSEYKHFQEQEKLNKKQVRSTLHKPCSLARIKGPKKGNSRPKTTY